ncbi:MAG: GAF domain-containing protein [Myxococcales bacterium]|jgi:L-methionine (R)-S-oxide reductase|nr:GAF domain-containing protein [Myxococcales bacterium]HRC57579.1 GAF domain-containing protein [Kofleriaceae bacterium]
MEATSFSSSDPATRYGEARSQLQALCDPSEDLISNLANATALLRDCIPAASWVGFYVRRGAELVLGPFQGKVACTRIPLGRGVCGAAASSQQTVVVPDVEQFPGHIACDSGSRSEIVVPIVRAGQVVAVLDVDSYELAAFGEVDARGLGALAEVMASWAW